jgi:hypothetical protein
MFPALLILRRKFPDKKRPYVVPGGRLGAWLSVILTEGGILFAIVLFFYSVPSGTPKITYWGITGGGTVVTLLVGLLLYRASAGRGDRLDTRSETSSIASGPGI